MHIYQETYIDPIAMKPYQIQVRKISTSSDFQVYDKALKQLPDNPFLRSEMFELAAREDLIYATLYNETNSLLLLYTFIVRKINLGRKRTTYFDITSPYGFCGPLFISGLKIKSLQQFWRRLDLWYKQNNIVSEFVRFSLNENWLGYTGKTVATLNDVCGKIVSEEEQWKNFKPKVRNNVRKALKNGLYVKVYHKNIDIQQINDFYGIYTSTMKRHNADSYYFHKLEYFRNFINNNPKGYAIALVYQGRKAVSTELLLLSENRIYSFLGGTDDRFFSNRPNDLLKIEIMNWARRKGYTYYHLGGGREENDNLYKYKKSFFPKDEDCTYYTGRKIINPEVYNQLVSKNPADSNPISKSESFFPLYRCLHDFN